MDTFFCFLTIAGSFYNAPKNNIDYVNNLKNGNIYNLYLVDNRCFFDIHDSRTLQNEYTGTVFEYFPESNSVEKLVQFKKNYTRHVEPY